MTVMRASSNEEDTIRGEVGSNGTVRAGVTQVLESVI